MKRFTLLLTSLLCMACLSGLTACDPDGEPVPENADPGPEPPPQPNPDPGPEPGPGPAPDDPDGGSGETAGLRIAVRIGTRAYTAELENSGTGRAFAALLPMTLSMSELNGNEKYCYLDGALPAAARCPGTIRSGDLMLYGTECVVLFYADFATSYSYTRLGRIDSPEGLAQALGTGSVTVTFELNNEKTDQ